MVTLLLFIALIVFLAYIWLRPDSRTKALADKLPGPPPRFLIGNALDVPLAGPKCQKIHEKLFKDYGWQFTIWTGPKLLYACANSSDVEAFLKSSSEISKGFVYKYLTDWLGDGLLLSSGEKWHLRRKALTPSFHFQILEEFVEIFEKNSDILVSCLKERVGKGEFELTPYTGAYTLDVITETSMRTNVNAQLDPGNTFVKATREVAHVVSKRMNNPWLFVDLVYKLFGEYNKEQELISVIRTHYNKIMENIKSELTETSSSDDLGRKKKIALLPSLLKLKLENNPAFKTDIDVREEVETFVFEGHDTTTAGINFTLGCLARHPEIQEKAFKEVKEVLSNVERVTLHDLNQLKYLERVIKESLRLYPSVPVIARQLKEDISLPTSGNTIPGGTMIAIHIFFLHRNPEAFPHPEVFNPDNFLPENVEKRPLFAYLPFSSGLRNCIGQKFAILEMKSALAKLLLNYKFSCSPETSKDIPVSFEITLQPINGHKIEISKR